MCVRQDKRSAGARRPAPGRPAFTETRPRSDRRGRRALRADPPPLPSLARSLPHHGVAGWPLSPSPPRPPWRFSSSLRHRHRGPNRHGHSQGRGGAARRPLAEGQAERWLMHHAKSRRRSLLSCCTPGRRYSRTWWEPQPLCPSSRQCPLGTRRPLQGHQCHTSPWGRSRSRSASR